MTIDGGRWSANTSAEMVRRPGLSPRLLGVSATEMSCPDIWELSTGDYVVIGVDVTDAYRQRMPVGAHCGPGERLVMIPRTTLVSARDEQ